METLLVTGGSGFVGHYIVDYLKHLYKITTLGMSNEDINFDLSSGVPKLPPGGFDNVIHLAGKAHSVPTDAVSSQSFFDVNQKGLENLLKALEHCERKPKRLVLFSTVAVYGLESGELIKETTPCRATDPYGKSKIMAEITAREWASRNNAKLTILRLPLVVGKTPPGNLGDMIKAIKHGRYIRVGTGNTRRSMVLAWDIAPFIITTWDAGGCYHLTDGYHPSFNELSTAISKRLETGKIIGLPLFILKIGARSFDILEKLTGKKMPLSTPKLKKLVNNFTIDDSLARSQGWISHGVTANVNQWID